MKFTHRVGQCLVLLLLVLLAGCSKGSSTAGEIDPIAYNPGLEDVSAGSLTQSITFQQLQQDFSLYSDWYRGNYYEVSTHSFDASVSGIQLDTMMSDMTRYTLSYGSNQMQQSDNVVSRSISTCYLNTTDNEITWNTDSTGLVYHVRQRGSGWRAIVHDQTISLGDQPVLALTIKNTTSNIVQFGGSSNCGPISPYGYARWYISRPVATRLAMTYTYRDMTGSGEISLMGGGADIDSLNSASWGFVSQAYPKGTVFTASSSITGVTFTSGSLSWASGEQAISLTKGMFRIETSGLITGNYEVKLYDQWGSVYSFTYTVYDRIITSSKELDSQFDTRGYYRGYQTQSQAIVIDHDATNKLLARQYSGVTIAQNVRFRDCYDPSCFALDIKIQSGQSIKSMTVVDIFGMTGIVNLDFTMGTIKKSLQYANIRGEGINILTQGVWDNAIQVDYENIAAAKLFYYSCQWKPELDITNKLNQGGYDNSYTRLEDLLFACETGSVNQPFTSSTTKYRDPQTSNLAVPTQLKTTKVFAAKSEFSSTNTPQLFIQTQIGIYAKQSSKQATIWLFDLKTGLPITGSVALQFYQLNPATGWSSSGSVVVNTWPYVSDTTQWGEMTALTAKVGDQRGFVTLGGRNNQTSFWTRDRGISVQSAISIGDVSASPYFQSRGSNLVSRVYAYTDRGLYKPGDELFVAGWGRKLSDIGRSRSTVSGSVSIAVKQAFNEGITVMQLTGLMLDQFGGFNGMMLIPDSIQLGDYIVEVTDPDGTTYMQTIKINEYQKPTFFIDQTLGWSGEQYHMSMKPEYYFGGALSSWKYQTDWSIVNKDRGRRWRDDTSNQDYYYDMRLEYRTNTTALAGKLAGGGVNKPIQQNLIHRNKLPSESVTIKVSSTVTDLLSDETHTVTDYATIEPQVSIGLAGSPYDWYYADTIKNLTSVSYVTSGEQSMIDRVTYTWYYFDWRTQSMSKGVDGSLYYNGQYYQQLTSGSINKTSGAIPTKIVNKPGDWLLVVQARDESGMEIGHNEKSIWYADGDGYSYGALNNNYTLTVSIDQKQYDEGEKIPVNINPYVKGSTVLITVEQGDRIVDSYLSVLGGAQLSIPAKKSYYPSAIISVTQIAGSNITKSATTRVRSEPRMRQGYSQVKINQDLFKLNIDISTDKKQYLPGEKLTLTIKTTDHMGKPVDARLSVGIVDKSLNDLYSYFKSPLSDFFLSLGTTITNYTNMKWFYQGLKVFTQEGGKGGGGGGRNPLGFLRQKFEDVAYRRGGVYTTNGVRTTTLTLPDNLTTWTIDVIGITQDSKVGTTTKDFIATKDLIVQPNMPLYLTIGDRIDMPVKILGLTSEINKLTGKEVQISGSITTTDGQLISLIQTKGILNGNAIVPITVDTKWYQYHNVIIEIDARIGEYRDRSRQVVPLRTEGLKQTSTKTSITKQGSLQFIIPDYAVTPQISLSLGHVPIVSLENQFDYLIRYPYGCAEQTTSALSALLAAQSMTKYGLFTRYFSGDRVLPGYGESFSLTEAIVDVRTRLRTYQQESGGFGYWGGGDVYYTLSAYIYSMMAQYPQLSQGYETKLAQLERYLDSNGGADNPDQYLYYLYQKSRTKGGVNLAQVQQLIDSDKTARVVPELLGAAIAVNIGNIELATKWFETLSLDDFDGQQSEFGSLYPLLTPRSALEIYQSLLYRLAGDSAEQKNEELILSLIRQRDSQGMWGYSTVDNLAVLKMLGVYQSHKNQKPITCTLTDAGVTKQITIASGDTQQLTITGVIGDTTTIKWSCDTSIVVDAKLQYLNTSPRTEDLTKKNVEYLQWLTPSSGVKIGQTINAVAQFKISQSAPHTAIELYVPSTVKLSDIIDAKQKSTYDLPFTVEGSWNCRPDHYEVRFDRLFLYYDTLEANQSCRITIPAIVAYSGSTVLMPSKIWQMYDDSVYATQMPTIK